ncbi:hypothetical protein [Kiloniella sp.]|uniref:hypothetical protein n=1 Tax=Kiloniella sp. TaxID=1938587 RepID=UPI003B02EB12
MFGNAEDLEGDVLRSKDEESSSAELKLTLSNADQAEIKIRSIDKVLSSSEQELQINRLLSHMRLGP